MSDEIKRGEDDGEIILRKDGKPICSVHGNSLWIEEPNVTNNDAFCMRSDKVIPASKGLRLTKAHLSMKNVPSRIGDIAGQLHHDQDQ
jgi:hypothetical protein